jgi:subtilase family serine protease
MLFAFAMMRNGYTIGPVFVRASFRIPKLNPKVSLESFESRPKQTDFSQFSKGTMMIRKPGVSLLAIAAVVAIASLLCQAQPQNLLTRHTPTVVLNGHTPSIGRLPADKTMQLNVVLALRDHQGLESFLQQVYDPTSAFYHHYLTVEQFTEKFGPTQEDYDAVVSFAKANGFTVVGGSRDALDVEIKGSVAHVESAFHVNLNLYHDNSQKRDFYAADREPSVDLPFQLWHISGLDNYSIPHSMLVRRPPGVHSAATTGSCPQQSFCGSDMRAAYYEGTSLTGSGQNIGLLEYAGFDIADINTYYKNAGQTRTAAVKGISTDGTSVNCFYNDGCDDTEQSIDITQALGMAPGVTTLYVYVGSSDTAILGAMSSDKPLPLSLSSSWGWSADPSTDNPYFEKMASQGQSFFQASADSGGYEGNAPWPCNAAWVISTGGTDLTTTGPGGDWASESVWSDGGGGWGSNVPIPSWQQLWGVITKANEGSTSYRNAPDVAANANFTFYVCADQQACSANEYGGTSFAAPMWAGYLALANQQAATNGDPAPGFIDPAIYPIGLGSIYNSDFHDITSGSNGFPTGPGYDLGTGWGSPNQSGLISTLLGSSPWFGITPSPTKIKVVRGKSGTSTITSTVYNGFDAAVTLSGKGFSSITFSPNPIPAPGSGTSTVTIKVPKTAKLGNHTVTITGTGNSQTDKTTIIVDVIK